MGTPPYDPRLIVKDKFGNPIYDYNYGMTTDPNNIASAQKLAGSMIKLLERGHTNQGFGEQDCLSLLAWFLAIGQWSRGANWARPHAAHFTFARAPRQHGSKVSTMLLFWTKKFYAAWEPNARRAAFDEMKDLMFDFVYAFRGGLAGDRARAAKFESELRRLANVRWETEYTKFW